jgi:lipoate-protein ligase A
MTIEDVSFADPQENLERDDALLARAEHEGAGESLRFWESPVPFVVLGRTCEEAAEVLTEACRRDLVPVLRRSSGGGTVVQGAGCLNFALVLAKDRHPDLASITSSYRYILGKVAKALELCGIVTEFRPVCDLVLPDGERKFSGNAQRRGRRHVLHHGTVLYAFDLALIGRYLRMPPRMPDYRRERGHGDFVTNIPLDPQRFKRSMAGVWQMSPSTL